MGDHQYDRREFIGRVGTFFLIVGGFLFAFFLLADKTEPFTALGYFCWSVIVITVGFIFKSAAPRKAISSGRFSIFQRLGQKAKENKEKAKK